MKADLRKYGLVFAALLLLCYFFPYTGDDWAWGSKIGLRRLYRWFDDYNGRYFGNLIVLFLTRFPICRTVIMAGILSGIIALLDRLSGECKNGMGLILVLFAFIPVPMLRESIVWTSGFANYSTSAFLILLYLYCVKKVSEEDLTRNRNWMSVLLFVVGFCGTLIVEHVTIYLVISGILINGYLFIKEKRIYPQCILFLSGALLGAFCMFSNTAYHSVASGTDGYRSLGMGAGIWEKARSNYLNMIMKAGFLENVVLNVCLALVCFVVLHQLRERYLARKWLLGNVFSGMISLYAVLSLVNALSEASQNSYMVYFEGVATIVFFGALTAYVILLPVQEKKKTKLLFILGSIVCLFLPLLVVSPLGHRCFFAAYILWIWLLLELWGEICWKENGLRRMTMCVCCVAAVAEYASLLYVYSNVHICDQQRVEQAKMDVRNGLKVIEVEKLPYEDYVWYAEPEEGSLWENRFKRFYGIKKYVRIKNVPYNRE